MPLVSPAKANRLFDVSMFRPGLSAEKACARCGETRPRSEFYPVRAKAGCPNQDPHHSWCVHCYRQYQNGKRKENPTRARELERKRYPREREKRLLRVYGLSMDDYMEILRKQGGGCGLCGRTPEEEGRYLAVDHCHTTGAIRGLLCRTCNQTIGRHDDDPEWFARTAAYLEAHRV